MPRPTIDEIERRAHAGEADAQYAHAALLAGRQQAAAAQLWLERAAAQGHADALFTLAGSRLTLTEGDARHRIEAFAGLRKAREKGSLAALRVLAALAAAGAEGEADWRQALSMMREACGAGDAAAMRETAALLLEGDPEDEDGAALLAEASKRDVLAGALETRRSHRGLAPSIGAFSLDRAFGRLEGIVRGAIDDRGVRESVCGKPHAFAVRGAVGVDLCDHLIATALPRLKRQEVMDPDGRSRPHPHRTAWGAGIGFGFADLPAVYAGQRMARLAAIPYDRGEILTILRYRRTEQYRPHYDFLDPDDPDLVAHGQRVRTALLYLNDGYEGGETYFLMPRLAFPGKTGDVLVFDNIDQTGAPDLSARHAGMPVTAGEKWLATLWFRDRKFAP